MAFNDHVGKAMDLLKQGLSPFVERELKSSYKDKAIAEARRHLGEFRPLPKEGTREWDVAALLKVMWGAWNDVFRGKLGPAELSLVNELRGLRNRWAHRETFSDDAYRALDSAASSHRFLCAPSGRDREDGACALACR
jgi:hypothetical protein